jgi:hypothetical protein
MIISSNGQNNGHLTVPAIDNPARIAWLHKMQQQRQQ